MSVRQLRRAPFMSARSGPFRDPYRWPGAVRSRGGVEFTLPSIRRHRVSSVPGAAQPLKSRIGRRLVMRYNRARLHQLPGRHLSGLTARWSEGLRNRDERRYLERRSLGHRAECLVPRSTRALGSKMITSFGSATLPANPAMNRGGGIVIG